MYEKLNIRLATAEDCKKVFDLSNDPVVRANSIHQEQIKWDEHCKWYKNKINDRDCFFYTVHKEDQFIGYIHLDRNEHNQWIITIHILPTMRAKGYGTQIIYEINKLHPEKFLISFVKEQNFNSLKIFIKNEYKLVKLVKNDNSTNLFLLERPTKIKKILISPIGGQAIYGIIEYFKRNNYIVIGIDSSNNPVGKYFVDKFYKVPPVNDPSYKKTIFDILKNENIDVFLSWLDAEILFWNKNKNAIPQQCLNKFYINFWHDYETFLNKKCFYNKLQKDGFKFPEFYTVGSSFPIIAKPNFGSGAKNVALLNSLDDYKNFIDKDNFVFQQYIRGIEYTVDFIADNGIVVNYVCRKRNISRGICLDGEIAENAKIYGILKSFCQTYNINGLNNIQFIENNNTYYIIDFNPRPSGTIMLTIKAGVDLLQNYLEQKQNKNITRFDRPKPLKMIRYYKEYYYV